MKAKYKYYVVYMSQFGTSTAIATRVESEITESMIHDIKKMIQDETGYKNIIVTNIIKLKK